MGAGTSEPESGRAFGRATCALETKAMSSKTPAVITATTDEESTNDLPAAIEGPYVPREIEGACVIEASAYERTEDGAALRYAGSTPTHIVGLCSPKKARDALRADGYAHAEIDRAFVWGGRLHEEHNENAWDAVACAESAEVATDGGEEKCEECEECGAPLNGDDR